MSCLDLSARKVNGQPRAASLWSVNPGKAETCKVSMAVSETKDMSHDVFFFCCDVGTDVCVYHVGWRSKLERDPNGVFDLPAEIVPHDARTTGEKGKLGLVSSHSELEHEGMPTTIANSDYVRCLKRASERCRKRAGKVSRRWCQVWKT